jgi:CRISP-associated protein Cas1
VDYLAGDQHRVEDETPGATETAEDARTHQPWEVVAVGVCEAQHSVTLASGGRGRVAGRFLFVSPGMLLESGNMEIAAGTALLADHTLLREAWDHVYERDRADGMVGPAMRRFAADASSRLLDLAEDLASSTYRPGPLIPVEIPKDDGEVRTLMLSTPRDRVAERALSQLLGPSLDALLSDASHAYRPGRGVGTASRRLAALRDEGMLWAVLTDIDDFFPSIPLKPLLSLLKKTIANELVGLVEAFLDVRRRPRLLRTAQGIPQGGSLAPMLSNLYLDSMDRAVLLRGHPLVRYADNMAVAAASEAGAREALARIDAEVGSRGLRLGPEDTEIASFEEGFSFLGEDFNLRYPAADPSHGREPPKRKLLYVSHPGSYVRLSKGRVTVSRKKKELLSVPSGKIERVVAHGSVTLAPGLRSWMLESGVDCVFLSRSGKYQGRLDGTGASNARRRRAQMHATETDDARLSLCKAFVAGKLSNQRNLLLRYNRRDSADTVREAILVIDHAETLVDDAEEIDGLMGVEGLAARAYFHGLSALLPPEVQFAERTRRPPLDVINAALGYGYGVLVSEATTALAMAGLDPMVGFLHGDHRGRPSLTLDLVEEFRPLIVDTVVVSLARRGHLTKEQGRSDPKRAGVLLTEIGRKRLIAGIERRLLTETMHVWTGRRAIYRRQIRLQAQWIARCIDSGEWDYKAVTWR